mgnify:CR=1 FL=1
MLNNIKKYFLVLSMICLGFSSSQTYHIRGFVLDSETFEPLDKVNIFIENTNYGAMTDEDGFFNLKINNYSKNNIYLNVEMIGYKKLHLLIDLLENNAEKSKQITENFSPKFKKKEYLNLLRSLTNEEEYIN